MASPNPNGSYLQQADPQHFPTNATGAPPPNYTAPTAAQPEQQAQSQEVPKDEVGWYFVEQYYTTLNKTPERLNLFYNKKSVMVWGTEGDSLPVAHGRADIADKIAAHEFKDCKVRVSNVDSQASAGNGIVIQVLGEMSNNGNPNRKFSQTFFLAEQTNGYYVLNDIFRYLKDDDDIEEGDVFDYTEEMAEEVEEVVAAAAEEIVKDIQEVSIKESTSVEIETAEGDKIKVEEKVELEPVAAIEPEPTVEESPVPVNGSEEATNGTEESVAAPEEDLKESEQAEETAPAEPVAPVEEEPTPTPVAEEKPVTPAPVKATPPPPPVPAVPAVLKSWAALVASGSKPATPAVPRPSAPATAATTAAPSATTAPVTAAPVQTSAPVAAAAAPAALTASTTHTTPSGGSQWQTADSGRRSRTVAAGGATTASGPTNGYVKNVTEAITEEALRKALTKYGSLKSLEINKNRSCAFVEFDNAAALTSAMSSPLTVAGSSIIVEERRPHTSYRGGMPNRGNGRPPPQGRGFPNRDGRGFDGSRGGRGGRGGGMGGGRGGVKTVPAGN